MDSSTPSTDHASTGASNTSVRQKNDPAWNHVSSGHENGKMVFTCLYCSKTYKGGGINRMKKHLAGIKGDVVACKKVPYDVKFQMGEHLKENKKEQNLEMSVAEDMYDEEIPPSGGGGSEGQNKTQTRPSDAMLTSMNKNKRKLGASIDNYFAPRTTPGAQPSIRSVLASKDVVKKADMAIAKWMYDACIPTNALNSHYLQPMVDAIAAVGPGYKHPSYHAVRVNLLRDAKKEVQLLIDTHQKYWAELGCTIMADVDASDLVKTAASLFALYDELVQWVGPSSVVHLVTDNATNYVAVGRLLSEKYKTISWSPYAANCLNLILKDFGKIPHVESLAKRASQITVFIYNHLHLLAWLRKRSSWKEIVRPGPTRFATTFIALGSIQQHKHDLQALVTSTFFAESRYAKDRKAKDVVSTILDNRFLSDCSIIVGIVSPLIRLLRIVDSDEKPAMGYVYDGMPRVIKAVKTIFRDKKRLYKSYIDLIKKRWDTQLHKSLHAAAYWLNP